MEEALKRGQKGCTNTADEEIDCDDLLYIKLEHQGGENIHGTVFDKADMDDDGNVSMMSKEGLLALMELETFNEYSLNKGYLVIKNNQLIGIKPHLVGDGSITVGFGDYLTEDDFEHIKETVISAKVCYEKFLMNVENCYKSLQEQINKGELRELSQGRMGKAG